MVNQFEFGLWFSEKLIIKKVGRGYCNKHKYIVVISNKI